jgi:hypothetical protein
MLATRLDLAGPPRRGLPAVRATTLQEGTTMTSHTPVRSPASRRAVLAVLAAVLATAAWAAGPLAISPSTASASAGGTVAFSATGGAGGYTFSLTVNGSGGTIDEATGEYTAGPTGGVTDQVTVTDAGGKTRTAQVSVMKSAAPAASQDLGGHR